MYTSQQFCRGACMYENLFSACREELLKQDLNFGDSRLSCSTMPSWSFLLLVLSMVFLLVTGTAAQWSQTNYTDHEALIGFKSLITNDPSDALSSWRTSSSMCRWTGVICDRDSRVSVLDLQGLNLAGRISPDIGNLSALRFLYLQNNRFVGEIPNQIGRLAELRALNASENLLAGSIPSGLINCTNLEAIALSANTISGVIPVSIHLLRNLRTLELRKNQLTGIIPPSLGNLSLLTTLDASTNSLAGTIPGELGRLRRLQSLQLAINNLTGTVPEPLYNLSTLSVFKLAANNLHGELPSDVGLRLPNLRTFNFCFNRFTGTIPSSLHNMTKMQTLRISHNFLTGAVPPGLGHLPDLLTYNIGFNEIVDTPSILDDLVNSTKLQYLAIDENFIEGTLPDSLGNLSSSLAKLYIGGNRIMGQIPPSIGHLTSLTLLNMSYNLLLGEIPLQIGSLKELNILGLAGNSLSGIIPAQLGNLTRLTMLEMNNNKFAGGIPKELGYLRPLLSLDLSGNGLNGSIPTSLFTLLSLSSVLNLSHNSLAGSLSEGIGKLENIMAIDLSYNCLDGGIPMSVGKCQSLQFLSMCSNSFSGVIPDSVGNLKGLQSLDLSENELSGGIPEGLAKLQALQLLNLSFNNLNGLVPSRGIFKNHSAVYLDGNSMLCYLNSECSRFDGTRRRKVAVTIAVAAASAVTFLVLVGVVFLSWKGLGNSKARIAEYSIKRNHPTVSYNELCHATDNFDETNLIGVGGVGSVYKAVLSDGMPVAVKVLDLHKTGAHRSWIAECEAVRNVRHRNLVRLVTLCVSTDFSGNDFQALVYELMSNGSLHDWIHGRRHHEDGTGLSPIEVVSIAIDVASALEYMHNECGGQVAHCDIKPSNVLIGSDMTAKVGDFGLARLLAPAHLWQSISSTHGLKGSVGYIPPEYGYGGKASTKGDVYSYGMMLLEMITGKSPIDQSFGGDMNLEKWVRASFPHEACEVIDKRLRGTYPETCEMNHQSPTEQQQLLLESLLLPIIQVALCCVEGSPNERSSMHDVLLMLKQIKEAFLKSCSATSHV